MPVDYDTAVKQELDYLSAFHPTPDDIPSCLSLFDEFLRCNVLGSQMRSLYRYGEMASCSRKGEDIKFCMSLKSLSAEEKRMEWLKRRAEWWAQRRLTMSSEDVWDIRTEPLKNYPPPPSSLQASIDTMHPRIQ